MLPYLAHVLIVRRQAESVQINRAERSARRFALRSSGIIGYRLCNPIMLHERNNPRIVDWYTIVSGGKSANIWTQVQKALYFLKL